MIEDTKFGVEFQKLYFSLGYNGKVFLISSEADPVFSLAQKKVEYLGEDFSRAVVIVDFKGLGPKGRFDESGLDIFNLLLRFQRD
ncbi:MAG: hypothetical protein R6U27_07845 [Desulfobacterales bacterium]